jgi:hypothetical protein
MLLRISQHLLNLSVKKTEADRFARLIDKWVTKNGPEWTVERVKTLKTSMLNMMATGEDYKVPLGWASRQNRKGQTIFRDGLVHRFFCLARGNLTASSAFLRLYQAIELEQLSRKQQMKMEKAIEGPPTVNLSEVMERVSTFTMRPVTHKELITLREVGQNARSMMENIGSSKKAPTFVVGTDGNWSYSGSASRKEARAFDFEEIFSRDKSLSSLWKGYPGEVSRCLFGSENYPFIDVEDSEKLEFPCGSIVAIQEGGCKVRWIANPLLPIQALGEPLKDKLFAYSKMCYPGIYTHDQDTGRDIVAGWLSEKRTVYSYDCTSFTDRFPLVIQEFALSELSKMGITNCFDMDAFALVMSKDWYSPRLKRTLRWGVGQPLGYGPSFHLATVSHAMVLDNLDERKTGLWCVVGDDVVISDTQLAIAYEKFMTSAGVEINASKSVISAEIAEFLGKLILAEGVIPSNKVKLIADPDQVVQLVAFHGPVALQNLSGAQRELSLKCFLPEHFGGLGLRPRGMSYPDYLRQLNVTRMAEDIKARDVSTFHDRDPYGVRAHLGRFLQVKAEILDRNTQHLQMFGIAELQHHLGCETHINDWCGIPTIHVGDSGETPNRNVALRLHQPNWLDLQDNAWLLYSNQSPQFDPFHESFCKDLWEVNYVDKYTAPLLNEYGYVDIRQIASTLVGTDLNNFVIESERKGTNVLQSRPKDRYFFRNWKEFLKGLQPPEKERRKESKRPG